MPIRSKAIRQSARDEACTLNSPVCNYRTDTTVFCHLNEHWAGKGTGLKADDIAGFYGCSDCHDWFDNEVGSEEDRLFYAFRATYRTWVRLIEKGIITVRGIA